VLLVVAAAMIAVFVMRQRIRLISRDQRPIGEATVTRLCVQIGEGRIDITAVTLPAGRFRVSLLDQPDRDPSHKQLTAAFADGIVAINGGYFDEHFEPVGLYVLEGREISPPSKRSPLSAVMSTDAAGQVNVMPASHYSGGAHVAIQAGPFVIDPGGTIGVTELAAGRAKRTIVAVSTAGDGMVVSTSEASLYEIASVLADAPRLIGCASIDRAVNLDGGPSTTLMLRGDLAPQAAGGPVRNYLLFSPKP
jgi:uncharacterized protein YigE (DUF2233 family)